jgi:hypothetical protein
MRHRWMVLTLLVASSVLAVGQLAAADDAQVAGRTADQLNAQWAPNAPAYTPESVGQQRGPDKFGGWGGVLIGNLIAVNVAKSMLAAPNNTLTSEEALTLATQQVMDARQGQGQKGWGRIAQDLTGQKLGDLMKSIKPATASATGPALSVEKGAKGAQKSVDKASGKTEKAFSNAFDTPASHPAGVAVSGPGVSGGPGRGQDKDVSGKDVADSSGGRSGGGGHGGEGPGGGNGGGGKGK